MANKRDVVHLPIGVSDKKGKLYFGSTPIDCGRVKYDITCTDDCGYIEINSNDNLLKNEKNVIFIKMDIEGEELLALNGAHNIIQRNRPKLAICVYHKRKDLITIPQYLKSLMPVYKFYLRAHRPCAHEIVLCLSRKIFRYRECRFLRIV